MTWITTIAYESASGRLKKLYDRVKGPDNNIDNIMMAHSLRPHSMEGHMALYKNVLHHSANQMPKWKLEAIGVFVSCLNNCQYCVDHHFEGMRALLKNNEMAGTILAALRKDRPEQAFGGKDLEMMKYARKLTLKPSEIEERNIERMRQTKLTDGEILEINQVVSYFCYANRTVLGLGINTEGDILGLSPNNSDNVKDWGHTPAR